MTTEDGGVYGMPNYVVIYKGDWAVFEARLRAAEDLVNYIDTYGFVNDTQSALLIAAFRAAGKE
jgi:hypothetical protein